MALKGQILRTVAHVTVTASGKCITDFQKSWGRFHPGNPVIKSSVVEVSNSNFLVSKVFYKGGGDTYVPRDFMCKKQNWPICCST